MSIETKGPSEGEALRGRITENLSITNLHLGALAVKEDLTARFLRLLKDHVERLTVRGSKATGLCPFHDDRSPSFSADLEKCVWFCHPCARGGGVRHFALAVGERWESKRRTFSEADRQRQRKMKAIKALRDEFSGWSKRVFIQLTDRYRDCEKRRLWILDRLKVETEPTILEDLMDNLARLYHESAPLEWDLDLLTDPRHESALLKWWREQREAICRQQSH